MVLCLHRGRLQDYSLLLSRLEFYHLSLCQDLNEVRKALPASSATACSFMMV